MSSSFLLGHRPGVTAFVSVLGLSAISLFPSCAWAQRSAVSHPLDEVVVTATRTSSRISETVAHVTVIDRAELDRSEGQMLVEVLSRQPGLQFSNTGGLGRAGSLYIRGHEARHTVLLIDGVRVGSPTSGLPSLDNLPLDSIERIEIVRGPLSSLYGSDAVGGVVQVFTRRGRQGLQGNAHATAGSNRFGQVGGGVAFGDGTFDGAVQVQALDTRGFSATNPRVQFGNFNPDRDGFRQNGGTVRLGAKLGTNWRLDGTLLESHGTVQFDDGPGADSRAKTRTAMQSLEASGRVAAAWRTKLLAANSVERFDTVESASPIFGLGAIENRQKQFSWENTFATPLGTALALLERIEQDVSRDGGQFSVTERSIDAVGLGLSGSANDHNWQASVRNDRNSQFGSETTGSLGWGYELTPAWTLGASYGTSFVAPTFNQLYFPGFGNPALQPEEGKHAELSARWTSGRHSVRATWFDSRIRGFITSGFAPLNIPRTRIDGVTLAWDGRWKQWQIGASLDHLDPRNDTTGANFGKRLPRRARLAARAHADWIVGDWSLGATWAAFSDRFDDAANRLPLPGYGTVDLRADWRLTREWTLGARLNNAGDKAFETAFGYNQPGREFFLTARYAPR